MNNEFDYKEGIIATRKGGFGSSDAKMIAHLSRGGELSQSDRRRVAEMLGMVEHQDFTNAAMRRGNEYEQYTYQALLLTYPQAVSNPYYKSENMSNHYGFDIFNHIDMEVVDGDQLIWYEMKTSAHETANLINEYSEQLAWHWMLLREKALQMKKTPKLFLLHYPFPNENFEIENIRCVNINSLPNIFIEGFEKMAEIIKNFTYTPADSFSMDLLPEAMMVTLKVLEQKLEELDAMQKYIDSEKDSLLEGMKTFCIPLGITSLPCGSKKITYVSGTTKTTKKFDEKKFKAENPELHAKYCEENTSQRKEYITIK